jgi:hypothetical protein
LVGLRRGAPVFPGERGPRGGVDLTSRAEEIAAALPNLRIHAGSAED